MTPTPSLDLPSALLIVDHDLYGLDDRRDRISGFLQDLGAGKLVGTSARLSTERQAFETDRSGLQRDSFAYG